MQTWLHKLGAGRDRWTRDLNKIQQNDNLKIAQQACKLQAAAQDTRQQKQNKASKSIVAP